MLHNMLSLEILCIKHIGDNIRRFYGAYSTTEDEELKLKFQYLRKFHSLQILNTLDEVEAEHKDFLVNKYLKELNTKWLENCSWDDILSKFAEIGPNIQKLVLHGKSLSWENIVCHVPNVKTVIFKKYCRDAFLFAIAKFCPQIEILDVDCSCLVTEDGIKYLCYSKSGQPPCPALKKLLIYATGVGSIGIQHLFKYLPSVEEIESFFLFRVIYSIHKNDINALDKVKPYNLSVINLRSLRNVSEITDAINICTSVCPHLKNFSSKVFKQEDLDLCCRMSKLQELRLDCVRKSPLSINNFLGLKGRKLTLLELTNFSVSLYTLVQYCPFLNTLMLENIHIQMDNNNPLPKFNELENISFKGMMLNDSFITHQVVRILIASPNMKQLSFIFCKVLCDEIKIQILKCCVECSLLKIYFTDSEIEHEFLLDVIRNCSTLNMLDVVGCPFVPYMLMVNTLKDLARTLPWRPEIHSTEDY